MFWLQIKCKSSLSRSTTKVICVVAISARKVLNTPEYGTTYTAPVWLYERKMIVDKVQDKYGMLYSSQNYSTVR